MTHAAGRRGRAWYSGNMRALASAFVLLAACASSAPATPPPAAPAPVQVAARAPRAPNWEEFSARADAAMYSLATELDCSRPSDPAVLWCAAGAGWGASEPLATEPGRVVLVGLGLPMFDGKSANDVFSHPLMFTAMSFVRGDAGVLMSELTVVAGGAKESELRVAVDSWMDVHRGQADAVQVPGQLARVVETVRSSSTEPAESAPHGLRFSMRDGTLGELRRVGELWVIVEQPLDAKMLIVTLLTDKIALAAP